MLLDDCVSTILSNTSPLDACSSLSVSSSFRSAANSDIVWERLLPFDYEDIVSRSVTPLKFSSKKEIFVCLCDPILTDGGNKVLRGKSPPCNGKYVKEFIGNVSVLEKETIDLTLQRDVAQSQVQDLLRLVGDEDSMVGLNNYPHLRVQKSPDSGNATSKASPSSYPHFLDVGVRAFDRSLSSRQNGWVPISLFRLCIN
ncbi:F-box protein PP2-B15 [Camellia lanceoleosa]|uniref:F-box protein PP2-B15 n=1 Tax=Camellia lanceoleosa TaxID=1840588 RepID=A0ACC0F2R6_9ERIC|nr:F-box protein PP2-B15 [Camellia lanceoleosa]